MTRLQPRRLLSRPRVLLGLLHIMRFLCHHPNAGLVTAFVPSSSTHPMRNFNQWQPEANAWMSPTQLFGLRTKAKQKIYRIQQRLKDKTKIIAASTEATTMKGLIELERDNHIRNGRIYSGKSAFERENDRHNGHHDNHHHNNNNHHHHHHHHHHYNDKHGENNPKHNDLVALQHASPRNHHEHATLNLRSTADHTDQHQRLELSVEEQHQQQSSATATLLRPAGDESNLQTDTNTNIPLPAFPRSDVPFLVLPDHIATTTSTSDGKPMTKYEREFRDKISYFQRYSERDIALLKSYRLRVVMQGMAASPLEPAVYRAFEILYQDLPPIRLAGRVIFSRLQQVLQQVVHQRHQEVERLQNSTTLTPSQLEEAQYAFLLLVEATRFESEMDADGMNNDREHDLVLPLRQLEGATALWEYLETKLHLDRNQLRTFLNPDSADEALDFPQFILGLQRCAEESCAVQNDIDQNSCNPAQLLQELVAHVLTATSMGRRTRHLDPTRQAASEKYDDMLQAFASWKGLVPKGEGRRLDVLRGCFVGAENEAVREALRIVYTDHPVMRMAGNTIFAIMSALIPSPSS